MKQPTTAGAKAAAGHDLGQVPTQRGQIGPSDLGRPAFEITGDLALAIAEPPRRLAESEPAFRLTASELHTELDNRGRLSVERAPFEHVNGALAPTRSAVWPLGFALVLGASLGFAAGYEVASRQRPPAAERAATAAPAPAAEAASGSSGRESTEGTVRDPAAAATPDMPGADVPLAPNAAQPPAVARTEAATPGAEAGRLLIRSTPAGARVVLDGRDVGETPLTVRGVARGTHTVRVVRDGYLADQRRVIVSAARPAPSLAIVLARPAAAAPSTSPRPAPSVAALYVESRPAGASVFLDEKLIGTTPLQIGEVAAGDHTVRLELDGYQRWSSSVRVVAGERSRVAASLER